MSIVSIGLLLLFIMKGSAAFQVDVSRKSPFPICKCRLVGVRGLQVHRHLVLLNQSSCPARPAPVERHLLVLAVLLSLLEWELLAARSLSLPLWISRACQRPVSGAAGAPVNVC